MAIEPKELEKNETDAFAGNFHEEPVNETSNVPTEEKDTPATETATNESEKKETTEQPTKEVETPSALKIKIGDSEYDETEVKKILEDAKNDANWKLKNKLESEELNKKAKELEAYQELIRKAQERPEIIQQLFQEPTKRDFDAELVNMYNARPDGSDYNAYVQWEIAKDKLIAEQVVARQNEVITKQTQQQEAYNHNVVLGKTKHDEYVGKNLLSEQEYQNMVKYIASTFNAPDGKAKEEWFRSAYLTLYPEKYEEQLAHRIASKAQASIKNAKPADKTFGERTEQKQRSAKDDEDDAFIARAQQLR